MEARKETYHILYNRVAALIYVQPWIHNTQLITLPFSAGKESGWRIPLHIAVCWNPGYWRLAKSRNWANLVRRHGSSDSRVRLSSRGVIFFGLRWNFQALHEMINASLSVEFRKKGHSGTYIHEQKVAESRFPSRFSYGRNVRWFCRNLPLRRRP